jgi:hypothetical protein
MSKSSRDVIADKVAQMSVVNSHEHAWQSFSLDHGQEYDLPYLFFNTTQYLSGDLQTAGCRQNSDIFNYLSDAQTPDGTEIAWNTFRHYLDRVRNTSYYRYQLCAFKELFGVSEPDILSDRWREVSDKIRQYSRENLGAGSKLCSRMRVVATVLDAKLGLDQFPRVNAGDHTILQIARMDKFIHEERGLSELLDEHSVSDFAEWLEVFDQVFYRCIKAGAAGFKSGLAYNRRIEYSAPSKDEVAAIFRNGLLGASPADKTLYQDFMMNRLCELCTQAGVPLQIHTGAQAGIGHVLEDTRPTLLTSMFRRHGDLKVDLFHGGYPWTIQAGLMAKYFPNVYVNGCWLNEISPSAFRGALLSWIETVPMNKIFAWGGDHFVLENSYASLLLTKDLITDVLADLVDRDYFDVDLALEIAKRILWQNGVDFWGIELTGKR